MGVGYDAYRSVTDGYTCKLVGHHHTAFNMHVTVNESWHQVRPGLFLLRKRTSFYFYDSPVLNDEFAVEYLTTYYIDDMSFCAIHEACFFLK